MVTFFSRTRRPLDCLLALLRIVQVCRRQLQQRPQHPAAHVAAAAPVRSSKGPDALPAAGDDGTDGGAELRGVRAGAVAALVLVLLLLPAAARERAARLLPAALLPRAPRRGRVALCAPTYPQPACLLSLRSLTPDAGRAQKDGWIDK
eukprot:scaffold2207_cov370-Prasinococcus_capsulatus_cf.AAC.8